MLLKNVLLELFNKENLYAYETNYILDEEIDIILSKADINEFLDFCKKSECKIVFYGYVFEEKMDYFWNVDELKETLQKYIEQRLEQHIHVSTYDIDIELLLENFHSEICELVKKQNKLLETFNWDEPVRLDIYTLYNGVNIGFSLFNDTIPSEQFDNDNLLEDLLHYINEYVDACYEKQIEEKINDWEREYEAEKKRHKEALNEIQLLLNTSEELMEFTNGKLRHAYAKKLITIYEEKYDVHLAVGEVDVLVETTYKERKK